MNSVQFRCLPLVLQSSVLGALLAIRGNAIITTTHLSRTTHLVPVEARRSFPALLDPSGFHGLVALVAYCTLEA